MPGGRAAVVLWNALGSGWSFFIQLSEGHVRCGLDKLLPVLSTTFSTKNGHKQRSVSLQCDGCLMALLTDEKFS